MTQKYNCPPSELLGLVAGSLEAWCVNEAVLSVQLRLMEGAKLKPKKTEDNRELLKRMGMNA